MKFEREERKGNLIRAVAVVYFLGAMVPVVPHLPHGAGAYSLHPDPQDGDLPPFHEAPYVASPAVSGVTIGISQQVVVTNTITGELLVGDMPSVQLAADPLYRISTSRA
jgi:hypothetical protein